MKIKRNNCLIKKVKSEITKDDKLQLPKMPYGKKTQINIIERDSTNKSHNLLLHPASSHAILSHLLRITENYTRASSQMTSYKKQARSLADDLTASPSLAKQPDRTW
jgi:hypothetical protein